MNYILPRPDSNTLSTPELNFLRSTALSSTPLRLSGRSPTEPRPIRLSFSRSHNKAECTSQLGKTRASASIRGELIPPPNMDRPNDGQVKFNVDVGPMGCMGYDVVAPASNYGGDGGGESSGEAAYMQRLKSNRLLRILEKVLLIGGSIDAEALCVQSGVWVWRLVVDVSLVCDAGNSLDACVLAVVAALRHFRLAQVDVVENMTDERFQEMQIVDSDEKEPTSLPLHHTPVTATFALFSDKSGATSAVSSLIDPTDREEMAADGIVTWSYNKYGEMCCLDFPGGCELSTTQLMSSSDLGKKRCIEICDMLENALTEADNKAQKERLQRLKNSKASAVSPLVDESMAGNTDDADKTAEDEEYRKLALDYASGHIAASVKDNPVSSGNKKSDASSLFHAFLQSVKKTTIENTPDNRTYVDKIDVPVVQEHITTERAKSIVKQTAHDEITKKVAKLDQNISSSKLKVTMDNSSDEEENVVQLQSEFSSIDHTLESPNDEQMESIETNKSSVGFMAKKVKTEPETSKRVDDTDIDDLTMAIKMKKKKSSKKKKNDKNK